MSLGNHGRRNQRTDGCSSPVRRVHEPQQLVGPSKITDEGIPRREADAIAQASNGVREDQHGVRRVLGQDEVGHHVAGAADEADPALADVEVQPVVDGGGYDKPGEGRQEDEGDDEVGQAVVRLQVGDQGAIGCVVSAGDEEAPEDGGDPEGVSLGVVPPLHGATDGWMKRRSVLVCLPIRIMAAAVLPVRSQLATLREKSRRRLRGLDRRKLNGLRRECSGGGHCVLRLTPAEICG